ncbi:MAG: esterase-like activity of phytase family protein [Pseudomonadota bacterium]
MPTSITRYQIEAPAEFYVPYEGTNPLVQAAFPNGFLPSFGSGLAFKGVAQNGDLEFYCLTDRGPNGDGPELPSLTGPGTMGSKIFPAPSFTPSIGVLKVTAQSAVLTACLPIQMALGHNASGLPIPHGALGNSAEIPVFDTLCFDPAGKAIFHEGGIDSEAIAFDARRELLWITDEYGPFLVSVDPATGIIQQRYAPGHGLPAVLALRRANRGMEGMTLDPATDTIHAFLQSPLSDGKAHYALTGEKEKIERYARFTRWVEFDPQRGKTLRMLAYPLDGNDYADGRTGNAKLGDLVALGDGKFVVIEQGEGADGHMVNKLMLVDVGGATDISDAACNPDTSDLEKSSMSGKSVHGALWADVIPLTKTELLNLNQAGWLAEKAEGLALVDDYTLAMTNDNDFGMKTRIFDATGTELVDADATNYQVDALGAIISVSGAGDVIRVARGADQERPLSLWLIRFERPLRDYFKTGAPP